MNAPELLLLPGNMCDARLWAAVGARLDAAGVAWTVAALPHAATIAAMATALLARGDAALLPVGFSMGAIVALEMARQAPERIAGLGLIAVNAGADLPERAAARPGQQAMARAGGLAEIVVEQLLPNYLAPANRADPALRRLVIDMAAGLGPATFVTQSEALRTRADLRLVLPTLTRPTLLACGADDIVCPPAWHRRWADAIGPAARLVIVPDAGHMLPIEQPAALAALIADLATAAAVREIAA